jgi:hypothetical protein
MAPDKFAEWEKITVADYEAYIGFCIQMGYCRLPAIHHYWKDDITYRYRPVADRISRDRFKEITRYLHYTNNEGLALPGSPGYDRLGIIIIEQYT